MENNCKGRFFESCKASTGYVPLWSKNKIRCSCNGPHKMGTLIQYDEGRVIIGCLCCGTKEKHETIQLL